MRAAQGLYENGHITYMRTDSTNLAKSAVDAARELVATQYGSEYLPDAPRVYQTKVKNAQEAHEAIRPAGHPFDFPEQLRASLNGDEFRVYDLIWKRTVASQMADARGRRLTLSIEGGGALFQVSGKTIEFPGYLRAYVEGSDDPTGDLADQEAVLPAVQQGDAIVCRELEPKEHVTQPPGRFSEAALIRTLEELGIGRPSTYASIIETILAREYVFKKGTALGAHVDRVRGVAVARVAFAGAGGLQIHRANGRRPRCDQPRRGEKRRVLAAVLFRRRPSRPQAAFGKQGRSDPGPRREPRAHPSAGNTADPIYVRIGRYGPFLEQGERRASLPEGLPPDEMTPARAAEMLNQSQKAEEPLGICPDTQRPIYLKTGRFGPYIQRAAASEDEKPQNASLLKTCDRKPSIWRRPSACYRCRATLGPHPTGGEPVVVHNGRLRALCQKR